MNMKMNLKIDKMNPKFQEGMNGRGPSDQIDR